MTLTLRRGGQTGYTLLEVLLVTVVAATIATFTMPGIHSLLKQRSRSFTTELQGYFRRVQGLALADPTTLVRLRYDAESASLQAEMREDEEWTPAMDDAGVESAYRFALPPFQLVSVTEPDGTELDEDWSLYHWPDGSRDAAVLIFRDGEQRYWQLALPRLYGPIEARQLGEDEVAALDL